MRQLFPLLLLLSAGACAENQPTHVRPILDPVPAPAEVATPTPEPDRQVFVVSDMCEYQVTIPADTYAAWKRTTQGSVWESGKTAAVVKFTDCCVIDSEGREQCLSPL